jgi:UDP-glucose 4-epimerase
VKVLVTGAGGFIGRHLVVHLSNQHEVYATARNSTPGAPVNAFSRIEIDLAQPLDTRVLPARIDVIIHLAQANVLFPEAANELFAVNTNSTQQLLDYGRRAGARQFILASTGDVYGERFGLCREADPAAPSKYYGLTKHIAEMLVRSYAGYFQSSIMRLFRPYGPDQTARLIPNLASSIGQGRAVRLDKDDRPRMTPIYIDDVIHAIKQAMSCSYSGTINIAGDRVVSMRELAQEIGRTLGREPIFKETGNESADAAGDNNLMKQVLGSWNMVSLGEGLSRTLKGEEASS